MSVTDQLLNNSKTYAENFDNGDLPLPPAKQIAVLNFTDDEFKKSIQEEIGIKPEWAAEAFPDLDEDVRKSIARVHAGPFIPRKDSVRGFIYDVESGGLSEVAA